MTDDTTPTAAKPGPDAAKLDDATLVYEFLREPDWSSEDLDLVDWMNRRPCQAAYRLAHPVNTSDAPTPRDPVTQPDGGKDDVAFVERMHDAWADRATSQEMCFWADHAERLIALARRGASAPAAEAVAWQWEQSRADLRAWHPLTSLSEEGARSDARFQGYVGAEVRPLYTHPQAAPAATGAVDIRRIAEEQLQRMREGGESHQMCARWISEKVNAVLAATPAGSIPDQGWQPIASAPKDGTEIWVYTSPREDLPGFQSRCAWHPDAGFCTCEIRHVTHWRPLPAPPTPDGGCTSVAASGDTDDAAFMEGLAEAINKGRYTEDGLPYQTLAESREGDGIYARRIARSVKDYLTRTASLRACVEPVTEAEVELSDRIRAARKLYAYVSDLGVHGPDPKPWAQQSVHEHLRWMQAVTVVLQATRADTATPAPGQTDARRGS